MYSQNCCVCVGQWHLRRDFLHRMPKNIFGNLERNVLTDDLSLRPCCEFDVPASKISRDLLSSLRISGSVLGMKQARKTWPPKANVLYVALGPNFGPFFGSAKSKKSITQRKFGCVADYSLCNCCSSSKKVVYDSACQWQNLLGRLGD